MKSVMVFKLILLGFVLQVGANITNPQNLLNNNLEKKADESITRFILFELKLEPGSIEEAEFKKKTLALADDPGVKEMGWLQIEGGKTEYTHGLRIVFYNRAAIDPYVQSKAHMEYLRDVWKPVIGVAQLIDYTEPDIAR